MKKLDTSVIFTVSKCARAPEPLNRAHTIRNIHVLSPDQARQFTKTGLLRCHEHGHCTLAEADGRVKSAIAIWIQANIIRTRQIPQQERNHNQVASGWQIVDSYRFPRTQLITEKSRRYFYKDGDLR